MNYFEYTIVIILGLSFGSFINVCAIRLPQNKNMFTSSNCMNCKTSIKFYDNVPFISYLFLRGKARCCGSKISLQYPLVEILTGLVFISIFQQFYYSISSVLLIYFLLSLIILFITDLKHYVLPDIITIPLIVVGFLISYLEINPYGINFQSSLIAGIFSTLSFFIISKIFLYVKKIEGLGFGDVKLICAVGLWTGIEHTLLIIILSSISGVLIGLILISVNKLKRYDYLPFGCFIVFATFLVNFTWMSLDQDLMSYYLF
tara:strand:- start:62 stop:841 length:780 start_codon:yes stop_codon:yes gene_type:complete